ncbi:hypothetical protein F2Q70_00042021 [Brassica cretica]|uniref:Uncharacterized protein n=1 Tax=Brassica cretica TaxID=69181 RepID=A0A8S9MEJ5_BRACR|nr:hypothetical protein F2Q70_00042021 [Brassica cretica]KAF2616381.1 hypothetical protein F2Q68_00042706 [Brassica cretica]
MLQPHYHHALIRNGHLAVPCCLSLRPVETLQKQEQANHPQHKTTKPSVLSSPLRLQRRKRTFDGQPSRSSLP